MKATYAVTKPDNVECTLKMTMTLGQWRKLREQLETSYPGWKLKSLISDLVSKVTESFDETSEWDE